MRDYLNPSYLQSTFGTFFGATGLMKLCLGRQVIPATEEPLVYFFLFMELKGRGVETLLDYTLKVVIT
jgi:hypothetical protein